MAIPETIDQFDPQVDPQSDSQDDSVPDPVGNPMARAVLNSLSAHIAILNENGVILETNRAWRAYADAGGVKTSANTAADFSGVNYLEICDRATGPDAENAHRAAEGIRSVIAGEVEEFLFDYPCHSPDGRHWYYMRVVPMTTDGSIRAVVSHEEITALKLAEESLREREGELRDQAQRLEEANIALKVLLKQREQDKADLEQKVLSNIREMVLPYVERLLSANLKPRERSFVEIVDAHLNDIISPFLYRLSAMHIFLTPQEMQVAGLVKDGRTSKEIAEILSISDTTVHFHRKNLRKKFGLKNTRTNLRSYLLSLA